MLDNSEFDLSFFPVKKKKWGRPVVNENSQVESNVQRYKHKQGYNSRPESKEAPIERSCIGHDRDTLEVCRRVFQASGKFNRLCPKCSKWAADNG